MTLMDIDVTQLRTCFLYNSLPHTNILISFVSGRLLKTLADAQYGKHHLTTVEIVYNIISFIIAIVTTIAFTVYAKRTLNELKMTGLNEEVTSVSEKGCFEMEKLPLERPKQLSWSKFS